MIASPAILFSELSPNNLILAMCEDERARWTALGCTMDQWRKLFFQMTGPEFRPGALELKLLKSFDPGTTATFGGSIGQVVGFGGALYRVPDALPQLAGESRYEAAFSHLSQLLPAFRKAGATKFILHMHRTYQGECNEEFTQTELRMLVSLDCLFFYVARTDWDSDA